ncbi:phosphoglycerate dehydrogenase [Dactylosporangium matsuzakiense]|uniref:D-3-phosphoglycerate dehydrogenase n=1 Tax=Dactylosporangium matsuzakiense TaxID=53360 RepID=A0A9W6KP19_9ACTN|nr:phosphoglycerate dehydrogenase [Dactylosporangium matsuzakiense]UWZ41956.1 phosphoglycerate dehydrogenase [Dactylosporangium matsuzakiense]GLL04973.1 D-3-phosphoglycerate dehydrogenase [Dactylosporangium matsuzakiense]
MLTSQADPVRVLFLENIHPIAVERMRSEGYEVETVGRALDEDELIAKLDGVHLLGIRSKTQVTANVLASAPQLRAIGAFCIGTDQIDLRTAAESGIAVFNAPFSNTRSVVELAIAEIIALTRRLTEKNADMHNGVWNKDAEGSHEIRGRSIGIVGYGNIGTQLSVLAENLGLRVYFYDTSEKLALGNAVRCNSLEELLEVADIVTLHVDGRPGNSGFFGEEQFARMRPRSIFLNLSRGFVIDHEALRTHLGNGHLAGAAVDVFPKEPKAKGDEFVSALRGLPNVILTPHIGGSTEEAQSDIGSFVAEKLHKYVAEGSTTLSVNLPSLNLTQLPDTARIALLHHNVPGVLADVNSIFAGHKVNVEGQILATRGEYGYLLTDIAAHYPQEILNQLAAMATTVQLRVLS